MKHEMCASHLQMKVKMSEGMTGIHGKGYAAAAAAAASGQVAHRSVCILAGLLAHGVSVAAIAGQAGVTLCMCGAAIAGQAGVTVYVWSSNSRAGWRDTVYVCRAAIAGQAGVTRCVQVH